MVVCYRRRNAINNGDNILENKSNNNSSVISNESVSGSIGENLRSSENDEEQRYLKRVINAPAYLNDHDVRTGEGILTFFGLLFIKCP